MGFLRCLTSSVHDTKVYKMLYLQVPNIKTLTIMSGIADRKEHYDIYKKDGNSVGFPSFFVE